MKNELFVTERLKLRPVELADLPELSRLRTIAEVRKHLGGPLEEKEAESKAKEHVGKPGFFVVTLKKMEKF